LNWLCTAVLSDHLGVFDINKLNYVSSRVSYTLSMKQRQYLITIPCHIFKGTVERELTILKNRNNRHKKQINNHQYFNYM